METKLSVPIMSLGERKKIAQHMNFFFCCCFLTFLLILQTPPLWFDCSTVEAWQITEAEMECLPQKHLSVKTVIIVPV